MLIDEGEEAGGGACSLDEAGGDTPANEGQEEMEVQGSGGGEEGTTEAARATSAAAAAGAPNSDAPLAPEHRRRRHVFVLSRSRGPVRNLDLEAIDF